jgi:dihydrolipoamide dehydrogenase
MGMDVVCVEGRGKLGGTCLNVGCIPSKALLHSSHMYHEATHTFKAHGVVVEKVSVDLPGMMKQKETSVEGLTKGIEGLFKKNKVEYAKGWGTVTGANEVTVTAADGSKTQIAAKRILMATGSEPMSLPGITLDEQRIVSSTGALSLKEIPKRLVVIGAGVIGLELGSVWSRLGSEVEVIEFAGSVCAGAVDAEIAKTFHQSLVKQGLKFKFNAKVTSAKVNAAGTGVDITYEQDGKSVATSADVLLVAIGRKPVTKGLGLEQLGVGLDKAGRIEVDEHYQTKVPSIYAIGDCIKGPMLAHKAEDEGFAAIELMVKGQGHVNYDAIPGVIYTDPEVAQVGKTEEDCKKAGISYKVGKFPMMANSRARTNDNAQGLVKVITDATTDRILGIHMVCTNAGELIAEAVLAMEYGASSEDIARTCHAHPTLSEALKEAAMAAYDKPIHF